MTSPLPPLYDAWMREALDHPVPGGEPRATCATCAMCDHPSSPPLGRPFFSSETECCTYVPVLPNFLLGQILGQSNRDLVPARQTVVDRIASGVAVTPLGADWPHEAGELYRDRNKHFGTLTALRCPHHLPAGGPGRCGIWRHRNSICGTWFCKHDRGETGRQYWMKLRDLLNTVEQKLTWHCVDEIGIDGERRERIRPRAGLLSGPLTVDGHPGGQPTRERLTALWGPWVDDREGFYRRCDQVVRALHWSDIIELGGSSMSEAVREVERAYTSLQAPNPVAADTAGPVRVIERGPKTSLVRGYSAYDPIELPTELLEVLGSLNGRPLDVVRTDAKAAAQLTDETVRVLLDWHIIKKG